MLKTWIVGLAMCAGLVCSSAASAQESPDLAGKAAPEFVRTDLAGRKIDLKDYRGKVVLLNFWATWCASCRVELPKFAAWQKKYGEDGLQVVAVSMDDGDAPVRRIVRRLHLGVPVVMGDAHLGEAYGGVLGLPVTFLIDRDGKIVAKVGGATDLAALESQVRILLASR
ncbi:MAG TPA: TlpA disulfide reductase family protein [Terracidiphilus sp.]|jgi:thiol-disulfide isomerase/thioredoxin